MDVPLVLSHRTAWLFYHAPHRHEVLASGEDFAINELGLPSRRVAERLQRFLRACGIPGCDLETIDILLAMDFMRTDSKPFRPHVPSRIRSDRQRRRRSRARSGRVHRSRGALLYAGVDVDEPPWAHRIRLRVVRSVRGPALPAGESARFLYRAHAAGYDARRNPCVPGRASRTAGLAEGMRSCA